MSLRTQFWICALLAFGCCHASAAPPEEYDVQEALYDEPIDESVESGEAETEFPYKAYINGDSVHVRSGPGQPAAAACSMAVIFPCSPNAIRNTWTEGERGESKRASSARVQTIFTGLPTALAARAAGTA